MVKDTTNKANIQYIWRKYCNVNDKNHTYINMQANETGQHEWVYRNNQNRNRPTGAAD